MTQAQRLNRESPGRQGIEDHCRIRDVVPRDGISLEGVLYYRGVASTVYHRNIGHNPQVTGHEAIILEGAIEIEIPSVEVAEHLVDEMYAKYPRYGRLDPSMYLGGVWALRSRRVLAWTDVATDATRFTLD